MTYKASYYYWLRENGGILSAAAVGINSNSLTLHKILPTMDLILHGMKHKVAI